MQEQIPYPSDTSAGLSPYGFHAPNPRVIIAAAQMAFGNGQLEPRSDAAVIVWGALKLAYSIADPESGRSLCNDRGMFPPAAD